MRVAPVRATLSAVELEPERPSKPAAPRPKVSIYLESRYRKLERGLPQTIFYCPDCKGHKRRRKNCERCEGYGKLTKDSVQELIGRIVLPAYKARLGKFHGAGREDIDVLMLGRGRPFVYEVVAPKVFDVNLTELRERILDAQGSRIEIDPFAVVERERVPYWKEARFDKVYRAEVALSASVGPSVLDALPGRSFEVVQRTPPRVAHRRADIERERRVDVQHVEVRGPETLIIEVRCAHGTYVKEWISGDEGRTRPSLADQLGVPCRCAVLDVLEVLSD